jgi:hypothetical protein
MCAKALLQETNIELFSGQEPLTKSNKKFPLELRAKTTSLLLPAEQQHNFTIENRQTTII